VLNIPKPALALVACVVVASLIAWFALGGGSGSGPLPPGGDGASSLRLIPGNHSDASAAQYGARPAITVLPGN
jgi:hypothetical protein